jgi:hypothetical protein
VQGIGLFKSGMGHGAVVGGCLRRRVWAWLGEECMRVVRGTCTFYYGKYTLGGPPVFYSVRLASAVLGLTETPSSNVRRTCSARRRASRYIMNSW